MKEGKMVASVRIGHGPFEYGGIAEVAKYLGATKQCVVNWRERHADFPEPVARLAMGPVYRLSEVRDWARDKQRDTRFGATLGARRL